ncbi:MAG: GGDEF domain-containing protein [Eubacteriaceae bacterium]
MIQIKIKKIPFFMIALSIGVFDIITDYYIDQHWHRLIWVVEIVILLVIAFKLNEFFNVLNAKVYIDPLTGLMNRLYLYFNLERKLENRHKYISLLMLDIDNFKSINDSYGHLEGDKVLIAISKIINQNITDEDFVVRWGGEEFIIVLNNISGKAAYFVGQRIRKEVARKKFTCDEKTYTVTMSIGIASTKSQISVNDFVYKADKALYKAKEKKNAVEYDANG